MATRDAKKDITDDLLLCNRCGTCRSVCPLLSVNREEWAGARGKVEIAEAFFRGENLSNDEVRKVFDYCLHCMACEENCPSGMRADEIVMAVRAEMARRGKLPLLKRLGLKTLGGADAALFAMMRAFGLARRKPLHGIGGRSPLSALYPLFGWPRERFLPLPAQRAFLGSGPELYKASDIAVAMPAAGAGELFDLVAAARRRNLAAGRRAYFFVGHMVNHFFPEEALAVTRLLNILGVDVIAPKNQVCCGAPVYYAGDIAGARKAAAEVLERFEGHAYDWIVTTCSSGGLMLKEEFPRIFDLTNDGYFEIEWDAERESFRRVPGRSTVKQEYPRVEDLYREYVQGKVRDINELLAELLDLHEESDGLSGMLDGTAGAAAAAGAPATASAAAPVAPANTPSAALPIVTYHQPCHLKRGQGVGWQSEAILRLLPGYRYIRMSDFDRCCGGGGSFTFVYGDASDAIAEVKMEAVAAVRPDVVATACPLCRIQLMDMIRRRFVVEAKARGEQPRSIPVTTPTELLLEDLHKVMGQ
ncbi:MAG: (Fe-S)-binding protein [Candidatus Krumholzibacteria bacterium]|nr:(Fe-S)-binding protein [Candidatus Krumholzibacteria bacterium]